MYTENKKNLSSGMWGADLNSLTCGCDGACGEQDRCGAYGSSSFGLEGYPVAMVYAPIQHFDRIFDLDTALRKGTIFEDLDLPFECGNRKKGGCCNG